MADMIIYQLQNKLNGKCYIGQTTSKLSYRVTKHINDCRHDTVIGNALRKYGRDSFIEEILLYCEPNEADYYETAIISSLQTLCPSGYNRAIGGKVRRGWTHTAETKEKIRATSTGRKHTEETKQQISKTRIERHIIHSPETLVKIGSKLKGRIPWIKGKTHTEATRKKISEKGKLLVHTKEAKQKISEASIKMWARRKSKDTDIDRIT